MILRRYPYWLVAAVSIVVTMMGCPLAEDQNTDDSAQADASADLAQPDEDLTQPDEDLAQPSDDVPQPADASEKDVEATALPPLAVVTDHGSGQWRDIYLLDPLSLAMEPLVVVDGTGAHAANLSWSPDGERLAYFDQGPLGGNEPKNPRLMVLTIGEEEPVEILSYAEVGIGNKSGLGSPMWAGDGQHIHMKMWTSEPPTSEKPKVTYETHVVSVDLTTGELSEVALLASKAPMMSIALNPQTGEYTLAAGYCAWAQCVDEDGEWYHVSDEEEGQAPCPLNRIDIFTVMPPAWEPVPFLASFDPEVFGICDGDRFAPVWSWDGFELAFQVSDCFLKVGDPFGENSVSGLAMWHTFVLHADGSFSKLTPWKQDYSEDSHTWGPVGSGMIAFVKGTPGETNVHFDRLAIATLETGDIQDITPDGFDHFYEIAWSPQ